MCGTRNADPRFVAELEQSLTDIRTGRVHDAAESSRLGWQRIEAFRREWARQHAEESEPAEEGPAPGP